MAELFIQALLGHLAGDYLLQTKRMALRKTERSWRGFGLCTAHVALYTLAVCLMLRTADPLVWALVFVPHWAIDRYSLASFWLKLIRGRTFEAAYESEDRYRDFDVAFTAIVYTVTDNALHLFSLWLVIEWVMV